MISARAWLLVVVSSGLQIMMFPTGGPMPIWRSAIAWIALVPFLLALSLPGKDGRVLSVRNSVTLGYLCGALWYFGNCFWIYQTMYLYGGMPKPMSVGIVALFSLYLGLYHALFAWIFALVQRRAGCLAASGVAPFLWVGVELARGRITGFPWDLLGYTQVNNGLITQIAPLAGVMGISFLVALVNAACVPALISKGSGYRALGAAAILVMLGLQLSAHSSKKSLVTMQPDHFATLLQENLSVGATGKDVQPESLPDELSSFTAASQSPNLDTAGPGGARKSDLIIWPEAPSHLQSDAPIVRLKLGAFAAAQATPLIVGSLGVDADRNSARGYTLHDSALMLAADGSYAGRYDKIHLVPWGEYVPYEAIFGFVHKLTEGLGNMDPGTDRKVFSIGGHKYGVFICYESIFGDEVREFAANGAEVLVNISDDGWYGETGAPWQHLNMARMRAIENHRWVLRSTNTGVTTSIDPWGRVAVEAPRHVRAAFLFPFGYEQQTTFYTRHGDWFAWLCAAISLAALAGLSIARKPLLK